MLYITTRGNKETFTSHRTLCYDFAPDTGLFVPFYMPKYNAVELAQLLNISFSGIVAEILNRFFSTRLSGGDIDFEIGRNAAKIVSMNHKIAIAELWHNPKGRFSYTINGLYNKITDNNPPAAKPTKWFEIAVRIAILFGTYSELVKSDLLSFGRTFDISVSSEDFAVAFAALYAKKMGLPIEKIICTTDDSSSLWDFIHQGTFLPTDVNAPIQSGLEMLVQASLGFEEAQKFSDMCDKRRCYSVDQEQLSILNDGLFCSVASRSRTGSTINSIFRSNSYIVESKAAFCYGGLQDFRAKTGESRLTLIFAEINPMDDVDVIASATGIEKRKLMEHINLS